MKEGEEIPLSLFITLKGQSLIMSSRECLMLRGPSCTILEGALKQNELSLLTSEAKGENLLMEVWLLDPASCVVCTKQV
jgi:hypothetical protein